MSIYFLADKGNIFYSAVMYKNRVENNRKFFWNFRTLLSCKRGNSAENGAGKFKIYTNIPCYFEFCRSTWFPCSQDKRAGISIIFLLLLILFLYILWFYLRFPKNGLLDISDSWLSKFLGSWILFSFEYTETRWHEIIVNVNSFIFFFIKKKIKSHVKFRNFEDLKKIITNLWTKIKSQTFKTKYWDQSFTFIDSKYL